MVSLCRLICLAMAVSGAQSQPQPQCRVGLRCSADAECGGASCHCRQVRPDRLIKQCFDASAEEVPSEVVGRVESQSQPQCRVGLRCGADADCGGASCRCRQARPDRLIRECFDASAEEVPSEMVGSVESQSQPKCETGALCNSDVGCGGAGCICRKPHKYIERRCLPPHSAEGSEMQADSTALIV
eukprot:gnl/TRDRNA2_/TRDRNA2_36413_c0_seq1.p1 gnl/TRDRNA2_/TRDRNA2_36413_c0~~gnl/TRDRNA2_/TRDRNA2_36413_c0_seq1.p1  ORF type:complete len:186 (-),score=22.45 gnl/TRDRNA2_/TRDRNA2_36413_c0_seq1:299-856(-)